LIQEDKLPVIFN